MGRRGNILDFRKTRRRAILPPGPARTGKLNFSRSRGRTIRLRFGVRRLLTLLTFAPLIFLAGFMSAEHMAASRPVLIAGADADSAFLQEEQDWEPARRVSVAKVAKASLRDAKETAGFRVSWADGDSGWINGTAFRLYGVDAPESSPARAKCESERRRALDAKKAAQALTAGAEIRVRHIYGEDKYGRELVDISADGRDVASALIGNGHLKYWRYSAGQKKPVWCR